MLGDDLIEQRLPIGVGPVAQAGAEAFGVRARNADIIGVEELLHRQLAVGDRILGERDEAVANARCQFDNRRIRGADRVGYRKVLRRRG